MSVSTFHDISGQIELLELSIRSLRLAEKFLASQEKCLELALQADGKSNVVPAVLLALQCPAQAVREVACDLAAILANAPTPQKNYLKSLLLDIISKREEILSDER